MDALIDNTTFAGAMRILKPDLESHIRFINNYPNFKEIDVLSFCELLTAIVLYDIITMESSSKEIGRDFYNGQHSMEISPSWISTLRVYLPSDINNRIREIISIAEELDSIKAAFDVMASPLSNAVRLKANEKIPDVYYSKDYIYRPFFEKLNEEALNTLNDFDLTMAMFLHRGLYLQATANNKKSLYMPHYYRGKMLSNLPPSIILKAPDDGFQIAKIPSKYERSLMLKDYSHELDTFYFELVQKSNWIEYNEDLPFIGLSIFESVKRNPGDALELALYYSQKSNLREKWNDLEMYIESNNRPKAEKVVANIKKQLISAARTLGVEYENAKSKGFWKLITSFLPGGKNVESIAEILPDHLKEWGRSFANQFIANTPVQSLLISHVTATR